MASSVFTVPLISTDGADSVSLAADAAAPSFRHFIAGPENQLVRCLMDATAPGSMAFPLITLTGPTGVGKSHLLHGVVERRRVQDPAAELAFTCGADFARSFARAVDVDSVTDWRDKLRRCQLFVVDDLQELATKSAAQQELVQTLDALGDQQTQVILAIRSAPLDWNWMIPALRSRLEGGLVIPIATPSPATSEYMIHQLYDEFAIPAAVRSLPAVDNRPITYPQLRSYVLTSLQAQATPDEAQHPSTPTSLSRIAKTVAKHFQVKLTDLVGPSRRHSVVAARGVAIYLARTLLKLSFDDIGEHFGGRDHTTILHAWRKTAESIESNAVLRHDVEKLSRALSANFEIRSAAR